MSYFFRFLLLLTVVAIVFPLQAKGHVAKVTLADKPIAISQNSTKIFTYDIKTDDPANKISAVRMTFLTDGSLQVVKIDDPVIKGGGKVQFTQASYHITSTRSTIGYVGIAKNADLPSEITVSVHVKGAGNGKGSIMLDNSSTDVVGTIPEKSYTVDTVGKSEYNVQSGGLFSFLYSLIQSIFAPKK